MLELDRMKMENKNVKKYLDWVTLRRVNNIQRFLELANYYMRWKNIRRIKEKAYGKTSSDNVKSK